MKNLLSTEASNIMEIVLTKIARSVEMNKMFEVAANSRLALCEGDVTVFLNGNTATTFFVEGEELKMVVVSLFGTQLIKALWKRAAIIFNDEIIEKSPVSIKAKPCTDTEEKQCDSIEEKPISTDYIVEKQCDWIEEKIIA